MTSKPLNEQANDRATYYAEARSWADKHQDRLRQSRQLAWIIAGIAIAIAALEAIAISSLAPLKTVVPYTILVDRQTGHTQILSGNGTAQVTTDDALTDALLAQYVIAREGFDIATVAHDYRKVALWSADTARTSYLARMQRDNPQSPIAALPRSSVLSVRVKSVSRISPQTALVRFDTERADLGQEPTNLQAWVAIIRYRFSKAPMALDDRLINPLGFQVTSYRVDQEAPPPPDRISAPVPASTTPAPTQPR